MSFLELLIEGLSHEYNPDYWSDVVRIKMGGLIDELGVEKWQCLLDICPEQSAGWRARLADASFLSEKERVIPLLLSLLRSPEATVGASAANILAEKNYYWDPEVDLVPDLRRHLETATPTEEFHLRRLLNRLPSV